MVRARVPCAAAWLLAAAAVVTGGIVGAGDAEPELLRATVGGYVVMDCHLDFPFQNPIPYHLQWDKDGESILSWYSGEGGGGDVAERWGGRVTRASGGSLGGGAINVSAVREADAGLYRCAVTFPNRSPPARSPPTIYRLQVEGGRLIATPPANRTFREGEIAELECQPARADAIVTWQKDGRPLEDYGTMSARAITAENGSLLLQPAAAGDSGVYSCHVSLPGAPDDVASSSAYLDVHYAARVSSAEAERRLAVGSSAALDCHFSANPPLTNLRWEKDGFLFDPYNVPGVFYSRNGSLLFSQVNETHEGQYSCTAYNALGTAGPSSPTRVFVVRPPKLLHAPAPYYVARVGGAVTMTCVPDTSDLTGSEPTLFWTKNDDEVIIESERVHFEGPNLTIISLRAEDRGKFACHVRNEAGEVVARTHLELHEVESKAPRRVTAAADADRMRVSWEGTLLADYSVLYRERGKEEWRMAAAGRGANSVTVEGLRRGAAYELRVFAQDASGEAVVSAPLLASTQEEGNSVETTGEAANVETRGEAAAVEAVTKETDITSDGAGDRLEVSARVVGNGALVAWRGAAGSRCGLRWVRISAGQEQLVLVTHTHHDHVFVEDIAEGAEYEARVRCDGGAAGSTRLSPPAEGKALRAAVAALVAALIVGGVGAALYAARSKLCRR